MVRCIARILVQTVYRYEEVSIDNLNQYADKMAIKQGYRLFSPITLYKEYRKLKFIKDKQNGTL